VSYGTFVPDITSHSYAKLKVTFTLLCDEKHYRMDFV